MDTWPDQARTSSANLRSAADIRARFGGGALHYTRRRRGVCAALWPAIQSRASGGSAWLDLPGPSKRAEEAAIRVGNPIMMGRT